jgi:pimeloyl-ACP methyl ester carboxylesterase
MPYITHQGIRLHYQIEGQGPPLVLQHGFSSSLAAWYQFGYVQALSQHYQLILLDARGHGLSAKPHEPAAYTLPSRVGDIVAVLDALGIPHVHFFGYSMGGWIGFGMAKYAPERVWSLIVGGAQPYPDCNWEVFRQVQGTDPEAFMAALEAVMGERLPAKLKPLILANDLQALTAAAQERSSVEEVLPTMPMPCLLFVGEADVRYPAMQVCAKHIAQATLISLPGLNHVATFIRSDLVLPHITRFLATVRH